MSCVKTLTSEAVEVLNLHLLCASALNLLTEECLHTDIIIVHLTNLLGEVAGVITVSILSTESTHTQVGRISISKNTDKSLNCVTVNANRLLENVCIIPRIRELNGVIYIDTISCKRNTRGLKSLCTNCHCRTSSRPRNAGIIFLFLHTVIILKKGFALYVRPGCVVVLVGVFLSKKNKPQQDCSCRGLLKRGLHLLEDRNSNLLGFVESVDECNNVNHFEGLTLQVDCTLFIVAVRVQDPDDIIFENLVQILIIDGVLGPAEGLDSYVELFIVDVGFDQPILTNLIWTLRNEGVNPYLEIFSRRNFHNVSLMERYGIPRDSAVLKVCLGGLPWRFTMIDSITLSFLHLGIDWWDCLCPQTSVMQY